MEQLEGSRYTRFQETGQSIEEIINIYWVRNHVKHQALLYGANLAQALVRSQPWNSLWVGVLGPFHADRGVWGTCRNWCDLSETLIFLKIIFKNETESPMKMLPGTASDSVPNGEAEMPSLTSDALRPHTLNYSS